MSSRTSVSTSFKYVAGRFHPQGNKVNLVCFQVNTLHLRDQWFYSIQWKVLEQEEPPLHQLYARFLQRNKLKFERILRSANRPEVLLKEMTVIYPH